MNTNKLYNNIKAVIVITSIFIAMTIFNYASDLDVELTEEEKQWLEDNPVITYAVDPNWEPVEFQDSDGNIDGITIDFLRLVEEEIGISFNIVNVGNWDETVQALKDKEVDVISASYHENRVKYMNFTEIYYVIPYIYIVKKDWNGRIDYDDVKNLKVATVEGWVLNDILIENHPGVKLFEYPTVVDALHAVSFGDVDVMIQEVASVSHAIESNSISNLKSAGEYTESVDLHFAIRKDYVILHQIMSKVVEKIPSQVKKEIVSKWIRIEYYPFYRTSEFRNIILGFITLIVLSLLWSYSLKKKVSNKTEELSNELEVNKRITEKLEKSLDDLKSMHQEMIYQEKMASLGSMVAGIAHEVNNPLGICFTTISSLEYKVKQFEESYKDGKVTKSELEKFILYTTDCIAMLKRGINQSIELLKGFKVMAVSQMYNEKVRFNVCDAVSLIAENMKYELKKKSVVILVECKGNIYIVNNEGAFSQIFTNLIKNSILHGFSKGDKDNRISISVSQVDEDIIINYSDSGRGIESDLIEEVFNLFYTTKKGSGGSGLGLYIVKNLVEEEFGGSIECKSVIGEGTHFEIRIRNV